WIVEGIKQVYYSRADADISSRIRVAHMDALDTIHVMTTHGIDADQLAGFELYNATRDEFLPVTTVATGTHRARLTVQDPGGVDVRDVYEVRHPDFQAGKVTMRNVLNDPQFYHAGDDLGLTYAPEGSTFKVWAPTA